MKAIIINNEVKVVNENRLPNVFILEDGTKINGFKNASLDYLVELGFKDVQEPTLNEYEIYEPLLPSDYDQASDTFIRRIIQLPQPTAQDLYDALIKEADNVFDEYRDLLSKAAIDKMLLGQSTEALSVLTQVLVETKSRIMDDLTFKLENNDIEGLKAFTFQTEEAEQLKEAIEAYK